MLCTYQFHSRLHTFRFGPLQGCLPLPANGTLPKFWDWLPSAKDAGKQEYMNTVVDVWAGMDSVRLTSYNSSYLISLLCYRLGTIAKWECLQQILLGQSTPSSPLIVLPSSLHGRITLPVLLGLTSLSRWSAR